jgi:hypothetical protein
VTTNILASNPPPVMSNVSVDKPVLKPPNHKMVDVTVSYAVQDKCDSSPTCSLTVKSNEPINGTGDGDTSPDWEIIDSHRIRLRAERSGVCMGRLYTITVTCKDKEGKTSTRAVTFRCPSRIELLRIIIESHSAVYSDQQGDRRLVKLNTLVRPGDSWLLLSGPNNPGPIGASTSLPPVFNRQQLKPNPNMKSSKCRPKTPTGFVRFGQIEFWLKFSARRRRIFA